MRLWIKDPLAILADGAERGVVIDQGRIVELVAAGREPVTPADRVFDAGEHVIVPGLINTHHHFYQTLTRALPAALDKELFPWLKALYPVWARLDEAALESAVTVAMAELMLSGCTTTTDHHYVFPAGLENAIDVEVAVARRLGMRAVLTRGSMNLSERDGGLPPDSVVQDEDTILADSQRLIESHHERGDADGNGAMVQIALAPCSPFSVTRSLMVKTAELAVRQGVRLHTHLAETEDENAFCLETMGHRPLDYLEECGWLNDRVWLAHGIHFTPAEIDRLAAAGTAVTHCPCSNQVLASGTCPVHGMESAGVTVGLGVDGSSSADSSNLIQEVRAAFLLQRLRYGVSAVSHRDALRWATQGSAACIGRGGDLGTIALGYQADLALFKLDEPRFAGHGDPLAALVLCGAHRADHVMIAGRWTVENGRIAGLEIGDLVRIHQAISRRMTASL
ncbi:hydroxydechloroatrazine ethylaminohydrolase [Skermanella stibiiresistens SB22]|uniref:Hydroxydechloroatrazine ethylaminohydrolase n=1 Tax=Skermanella stibiiresistens SB22 TaxID=1385369 RepID=W9HB44_9PROT|nr:8-oxoguanine deaminase [Skermanella stibiiresistens]EWY41932.1 hydroxydechloroatrazine ethylaminohydrolase [Skermanella stibiiresistens SB22]